jgi:potassium-dependent mechanosensitive channel
VTGRLALLIGLLFLALVQVGSGARAGDVTGVPPGLVTAARLEAKIAETESDPALETEVKGRLVDLYRRALGNLQELQDNRARADAFAEATRTAPEQTRRIRERLATAMAADTPQDLPVGPDTPLDEIERQLKREQAERDAADARRGGLDRQLAYQENRPAAIRQRLAAAQEEQEAIAAALQAELADATGSTLVQARRWGLETRYIALSNEIQALDQELIGLPMRLDLIAARRAEEAAENDRNQRRVEALQTLVTARREAETNRLKADAERLLQASAGMDPALASLAERNSALTKALALTQEQGDHLGGEIQEANRLGARTKANFERAQTAKAIGASTTGLGALLLEHHAALPDFELYARKASARKRQIAAVNLSRVRHLEEAEGLADQASVLPPSAAPVGDATSVDAAAGALWRELLEQRRGLLERQVETEGRYLERLNALQDAEARMLEGARAYAAFLTEQLFWLPTGARTRVTDLAGLPAELRVLLAPETWSEPARFLADQAVASPLFWLTVLLSAGLLWRRRALVTAIQQTAVPLAEADTDHFGHTLHALLLTLAFAAPLPLLLGVSGWLLLHGPQGTEASLILGAYLIRIALILFGLLVLRALCLPNGLGMAHFRWAESDVRRLGRELRWLTWALVPAILALRIALALNPAEAGGLVTRIGLLFAALVIGVFFYRVLHPKQGILCQQVQRRDKGLLYGTYPLWFPLLIAFPMAIAVLIWTGYIYTSHILADAFLITLGLIAALILLHAFGVRWLQVASRRLAWQAARQRRLAAVALSEPELRQRRGAVDLAPSADADLDLDASSEHSLALLRIGIVVAAAIGSYLIWSRVFPALGILDEVTLWRYTTSLDGDERSLPVTLADLGLALVYLIGTAVLAKRLPAVLSMILAQRLQVSAAGRYTITSLTTYAVIALGILLALNTVGAQWSQVQWLVAALGVGIGFGLQEIVANFISGLIILFERPIRIGDIVTVGDTDGVVTKIRIRATTIRNWDRKELLVPNKEFITGRLLNWSLSDQVTRVMVTVGVAYGTDVEKAHALMREAAEEHERVLTDPKPILSFEGFGDNALTLILRVFIDDLDYRLSTITDLHKAINHKFQQAGITIAYPQRDLHLDTRAPLRVSLEPGKSDGKVSGSANERE